MKKQLFILIIVFLFVINITALAMLSYKRWIRPQYPAESDEQAEAWDALQMRIALKPQQLQRMQDSRIALEQDVDFLRQEMLAKRKKLIEEARRFSPNLDRIDQIVDELSKLQAEVEKKTVRNLIRDKEVLTPSQQERYLSLFEKHMHGKGWGRGRMGIGRGPRRLRENQNKKETHSK
jgi:septal ring factor EnvC (AmiA/AmiB activator)